jgi:hypothetical protein
MAPQIRLAVLVAVLVAAAVGFGAGYKIGNQPADSPTVNAAAEQTIQTPPPYDPAAEEQAKLHEAQSNVRSAIPAAEAYYQDDVSDGGGGGSYEGMTFKKLRQIDKGLVPGLSVKNVTPTSYCLEYTNGTAVASYSGPGGIVTAEAC